MISFSLLIVSQYVEFYFFNFFRNALSLAMLDELKGNILKNSSDLRCIILKSEGRVFSSGHNLKELVGKIL